MSTTLEEVIADIDAKMAELVPEYAAHRDAMKEGLFTAIANGIVGFGGSGGGGTASATVVTETSFGQASSAGSASTFARGDHTHGTPAMPTAADVGADASGTASGLLATHVAAGDPHPGYALESSLGTAALRDVGTGSGQVAAGNAPSLAVAAHEAAADPHPDYLVAGDLGEAAWLSVGTGAGDVAAGDAADAAIGSHVLEADPHEQYALELDLGAAAWLAVGTGAGDVAAGDAPAAAVAAHVAESDPHPDYALESALGGAALLDVGTGSGDVAAGDAPAAAVSALTATLGGAAYLDVGTGSGDVAAGDAPAAAQAAAEATAAAALASHAADADLHLGSPSNSDLNGVFGRNFDITPVGASIASPGVTLTTGGTITAQIDTDGKVWARFQANAASIAGIRSASNNFLVMASGGYLWFRIRAPSSVASRRVWVGWQSTTVGSGATPAGHYAGLVMDSQSAGDATIYACARDGTTFSTTTTGVTMAAGTEYWGYVRIDASGVYVSIAEDGSDLPGEVTHTANLPGSSTTLGMVFAMYGSVTHQLDIRGGNYNVKF